MFASYTSRLMKSYDWRFWPSGNGCVSGKGEYGPIATSKPTSGTYSDWRVCELFTL